jgi:hypothetical protein
VITNGIRSTYTPHLTNRNPDIVFAYLVAKHVTLGAGYGAEIDWQASRSFDALGESEFLREYAWVVLSAGMREYIIRNRFGSLSKCFCNWCSSQAIIQQESNCRSRALACFNNPRKIDSIIKTAHVIESLSFSRFKESIRQNPVANLQSLPFIGPTTCYHLAKNIGLPLAKPDRHLVRLANSVGYDDVQEFCRVISERVHDSVPVVDIVLWRFATITETYLRVFLNFAFEGRAVSA